MFNRSGGRKALTPLEQLLIAAKLARAAGILRPVEVLLHEALPGPMTCGVLHPAIVLSADAPSWSDEDLHRGMLHELEHVGRGDRVSQCLARSVCALYWFHPLVWIAWRQLALEAERACDDAVLGRSEATAYAAQLVTVARRLSVAKSPLLAMANRVDLTVRVGALLDDRQRRGRAGRLAVALACAAAAALVLTLSPLRVVAAPQSSPVKAAATPEFEVVSVKLIAANVQGEHSSDHSDAGRISMTGSMHRFIIRAYGITSGQLGGEPDWFKTNLYAIDAVTAAPAGPDQMNLMLRGVLANRFQLKLRQEDRDLPVYVLEVAPGGPKFKELKPGEDPRDPKEPPGVFARTFTTMQELMNSLNGAFGGRLSLDRPVIDHTSLTGEYNMLLRTAIDVQNDVQGRRVVQFPDLFHDVQAELGLKLVPSHAKMPYFAVEHAAPPTAN